ncbi:MAG: M24 family metallopeptidase [Candidatus Bathyarchaeia archaeon]
MKNRIQTLKASFKKDFDGYIVTNPINILYFTDFLGAVVLLVPREDESILYVYGVNYEEAKAEVENCRVELVKRNEDLIKKVVKQIRSQKLKKLGFDAMNFQTYEKFRKTLKNAATLEAKSEYVWNLRKVKDEDELKKMRKAAKLTVEGMQTACETIKAGLREYEVAAEIEYTMRTRGSYGVAFDTIVASGIRSAYPHGGCSERKLKKGDLVVVDIGATYKNYRADMTRTFVVGNPSAKQEKIYDVVKTAQEKAFKKTCEGVKAAELDAAARNVIERARYGEYFVHGLGHGIGLEVHEQPVLNSTSKDVLKSGNVVTDEPGVYIIGFGGFRIEDTVLVRKGKAERLTEGFYILKCS